MSGRQLRTRSPSQIPGLQGLKAPSLPFLRAGPCRQATMQPAPTVPRCPPFAIPYNGGLAGGPPSGEGPATGPVRFLHRFLVPSRYGSNPETRARTHARTAREIVGRIAQSREPARHPIGGMLARKRPSISPPMILEKLLVVSPSLLSCREAWAFPLRDQVVVKVSVLSCSSR